MMDNNKLHSLFYPESVIVVGASNQKGKVGYVCMKNLVDAFKGEIYPVNIKEDEVFGLKAYRQISDVPQDADLAIISIPSNLVPSTINECSRKGVKAAVVITAGFAEAGAEGRELEKELVNNARNGGVRVVGPNCFGIYNCNIGLNGSIAMGTPAQGGDISFVTQSGAYGMAIYSFATDHDIRFAKIAALGNKCDVQDDELIEYFGQDDETRVICCFIESLTDGRAFFNKAREVAPKKPIIVTKTGRSASGSRAAASHTAAIAGNLGAYNTAFKQSGIIVARSGLEMIDVARGLSWQPLPSGGRVGILTNSGGTAVELTDLCEEHGLVVPELPEKIQDRLRSLLPRYASSRNPIDITPVWPRFVELYDACVKALFESPNIDIIMPILLQRSASLEVAQAVRDAVFRCQKELNISKPCYICWVSVRDSLTNMAPLNEARIPCYEWPERTARVAGLIHGYTKFLSTKEGSTSAYVGSSSCQYFEVNKKAVKVFEKVKKEERDILVEAEALEVLSSEGFEVAERRLCASVDEAIQAGEEIGYPVVLKVVSPDIVHKTDVGGVQTGINNGATLEAAYKDIIRNVTELSPNSEIRGVLVQKMHSGVEVIIGSIYDQQFGQMIMFGLGGIFVEVFKDVSYRLAPITPDEATRMIKDIKGFSILEGVRGGKGVDLEELEGTLLRISQFLMKYEDRILEMDLNPVIVNENKAIVADARIVIK